MSRCGTRSHALVLSVREFNELLAKHLSRLTAYAITLTRDRDAANDLLQETALRATKARTQFEPGTNFSAWIYRILRNQHFSLLRKAKRKFANIDDLPEESRSHPGNQENILLLKKVHKAMEQHLQTDQREVILLVCFQGYSYEEAAEVLSCSIGTVKSRLWRARKELKKIFTPIKESQESCAA